MYVGWAKPSLSQLGEAPPSVELVHPPLHLKQRPASYESTSELEPGAGRQGRSSLRIPGSRTSQDRPEAKD